MWFWTQNCECVNFVGFGKSFCNQSFSNIKSRAHEPWKRVFHTIWTGGGQSCLTKQFGPHRRSLIQIKSFKNFFLFRRQTELDSTWSSVDFRLQFSWYIRYRINWFDSILSTCFSLKLKHKWKAHLILKINIFASSSLFFFQIGVWEDKPEREVFFTGKTFGSVENLSTS